MQISGEDIQKLNAAARMLTDGKRRHKDWKLFGCDPWEDAGAHADGASVRAAMGEFLNELAQRFRDDAGSVLDRTAR